MLILSLANAGTPLMWAGIFQLLLGNFIIAEVEGRIIARRAGGEAHSTILVMVAANYASMLVGLALTALTGNFLFDHLPGDSLRSLLFVVPLLYALFFLVTCAVEYPIAMSCRESLTHRQFLRPFLLAQVVTNGVLFLVLAWASYGTLFTEAHVQGRADFLKPVAATLYYLDSDGTEVRTLRLDTGERGVAGQLAPSPWERLNIRKAKEGWEVYRQVGHQETKGDTVLKVPFGPPHRLVPPSLLPLFEGEGYGPLFGFQATVNWGSGGQDVGVRPWDPLYLYVGRQRLGLETPFLMPRVDSPTVLPSNQVICCLGYSYILLLDLETMRIGTLTRGNGPVVVLDGS